MEIVGFLWKVWKMENLRFWTWGGWRTRTWGWSRPCSTVCLRRSYETLLMLDPIQSRGSAIRDNFIFFLAKQIGAKFSATSSHLFSFFPLEIEVRNRHRAPKQQHNHSSQQAQAHHHAVTTQTLSRLTHTHSGKIGRGTFSAQATSQHSATIVLQCIAVISEFKKILINSLFQISRYLIYTLCSAFGNYL